MCTLQIKLTHKLKTKCWMEWKAYEYVDILWVKDQIKV
jgi:hypothetical protein